MKLDYLQFLELEVFTRFGARLEASMESAIKRGQILREILKQDRLTPQSIEYQMAWLVAFNDGLFDSVELEEVEQRLDKLQHYINQTELTVDCQRKQWSEAVKICLTEGDTHDTTATS